MRVNLLTSVLVIVYYDNDDPRKCACNTAHKCRLLPSKLLQKKAVQKKYLVSTV